MSDLLNTDLSPRERILMAAAFKAGANYGKTEKYTIDFLEAVSSQYIQNVEFRLKYPDADHQRVG